jgi:predicted neuraminidase
MNVCRMIVPVMLLSLMAMQTTCAADPQYQERLIFPLQPKHVHSSCIVECPSGDLLCCWFHGSGERESPDVVIQGARLRKGETKWSNVFPMADTADFPDVNPVLFVDPGGQLWLFWLTVMAERWEDSMLKFRTTRDYQGDGTPKWEWQDVMLLKPGKKFAESMAQGLRTIDAPGLRTDFGAYVADSPRQQLVRAAGDLSKRQRGWMTRTHMLVLPSGRFLLPLYSDGYYVCLMAISDDQGKTWRASKPIVGVGLNQPTVVRRKNGTLVAYMREEGDIVERVLQSVSEDDGETWSVATATDIPNPNTSLEVIALRDGRWVMIYNDITENRHSLALALSDDEGQSWKLRRHLEREVGGLFHYPSIIQDRNGLIHATYTHQPAGAGNRSIKHVMFNAEWLTQGD